jgi:FkbM family methyltransferase
MTTPVKRLVTPALGRRRLQTFFDALHRLALAGRNLGQVGVSVDEGERAALRFLRDRFAARPERITVFDVGANVGDYAHEVVTQFGDRAAVWALEPAPSTYRLLTTRVGEIPNVRALNLGVSDEPGQAKLFIRAPGAQVASLYSRHWDQGDHHEVVDLTTIDQLCAREGVDYIHLLKLDIEGHELVALAGAKDMLQNGRIEVVQFEFGTGNLASRTYLRDFFDLLGDAFDLYRILRDGLYRVPSYRYRDEVFAGATNYLAIRKGQE